jgi:hypothetical protein
MKEWTAALAGFAMLSVMSWGPLAEAPAERQGAEEPRGLRGEPSKQPPGGPFDPWRVPVMMALDANSDGEICAEEIVSASKALKNLDKDGDGKLTREELVPRFAGRRAPGGLGAADRLNGRETLARDDSGTPDASEPPTVAVLKEMHELCAEQTRLDIKKRYFKRVIAREPSRREAATAELQKIDERIAQIQDRLDEIERSELAEFECVARNTKLECSEEPLYGQPSYGIILYANATEDIRKNELLLFHADGVYRTKRSFPKLTTGTGAGWYFRPNRDIPSGSRFVVACIQDAPEEIQNVKNGYMPDSDRARDPSRAYNTQIFLRNGRR